MPLLHLRGWYGGKCDSQLIGAHVRRTAPIEHTELVRNGIREDLLMAAKDEVNFSAKAIPGHEPRAHPIIIYASCSPQHGGAIRWRATADMGHGIGGAIAVGDKCALIKGGGVGKIRGEHQVCPATAHLGLRAGRATRRIIEDDNPNRIGGLGSRALR
jgi:hypothetical protein